jgi:hypothetical protein
MHQLEKRDNRIYELETVLRDLVGAIQKARTMRAPAGHYDEDVYYNGIDFHAQVENAVQVLEAQDADNQS